VTRKTINENQFMYSEKMPYVMATKEKAITESAEFVFPCFAVTTLPPECEPPIQPEHFSGAICIKGLA
jgi:hypothetical protein